MTERVSASRVTAPTWPLVPMLAKLVRELPRDDARWGFELKWDRIRALATIEGGSLSLEPQPASDIARGSG